MRATSANVKNSQYGDWDQFSKILDFHWNWDRPLKSLGSVLAKSYNRIPILALILQWGAPYFVISEPENRTK